MESQEEIMARVEAEAQAEMTKRAKAEVASQARLAQAEAETRLQEGAEMPRANQSPEARVTAKMNEWEKGEEITVPGLMIDVGGADVNIPLIEKPAEPGFEQINMVVNHRYNPDGESSLYQIP